MRPAILHLYTQPVTERGQSLKKNYKTKTWKYKLASEERKRHASFWNKKQQRQLPVTEQTRTGDSIHSTKITNNQALENMCYQQLSKQSYMPCGGLMDKMGNIRSDRKKIQTWIEKEILTNRKNKTVIPVPKKGETIRWRDISW